MQAHEVRSKSGHLLAEIPPRPHCLVCPLFVSPVDGAHEWEQAALARAPVDGRGQEARLGHFTAGYYLSSLLHPLGLAFLALGLRSSSLDWGTGSVVCGFH